MKLIVKEIKAIIRILIRDLPGPLGMKIRTNYYKKRFCSASDNFYVLPNVTIMLIVIPRSSVAVECAIATFD